MARTIVEYSIFLGSTGEVAKDRDAVREHLESSQFGQLLSLNGLRLAVSDWTDVAPQAGQDGQAIINSSVVESADLVIALFRQHLGTPTARDRSGTAEEVQLTLDRFLKGDPCNLMVYFHTVLDGTILDPEEYSKLLEFKREIQCRGVLTRDYCSVDDLIGQIGPQVIDIIGSLAKKSNEKSNFVASSPVIDEEEFGIFDLADNMSEGIVEVKSLLGEATYFINELTEQFVVITERSQKVSGDIDAKELRSVVSDTGDALNNFAVNMEIVIANLNDVYLRLSESIVGFTSILSADFGAGMQGRDKIFQQLIGLSSNIRNSMNGTLELSSSMSRAPRLTQKVNKARRRAIAVLDDFRQKSLGFADKIEAAGQKLL